jgi:hypothetical protein
MGVIKLEEIEGAQCRDEIICKNCLTTSERLDLEEDDIITFDLKEKAYKVMIFCDRCGKRL